MKTQLERNETIKNDVCEYQIKPSTHHAHGDKILLKEAGFLTPAYLGSKLPWIRERKNAEPHERKANPAYKIAVSQLLRTGL